MNDFRLEKGIITKLTIARAKAANSLNREAWRELYEILVGLNLDHAIKVIIMTGEGEKAFCAGSDISQMVDQSAWEAALFDEVCHKAHLEILRMTKPVIAALNGVAFGGGCTLAAACDFRIACDTVKMGLPEIGLGIIPGAGGIEIVTRLIGLANARKLIFTGDVIDAKQALEMRLLDKVVPKQDFDSAVQELAKNLAEKSAAGLIMAKMAMGKASGLLSESAIPYDVLGFSLCSSTEEKKIAMENFLARKRKA